MKLIYKISQLDVFLAYLKSEWYSTRYDSIRGNPSFDVNKLDPSKSRDQEIIYLLLFLFRSTVLTKLPADTDWYVAKLEKKDFGNLNIMREGSWSITLNRFGTKAKATKVKEIAKLIYNIPWCFPPDDHLIKVNDIVRSLQSHDFDKNRLIGIKSTNKKTITLIEGNHRALGFQVGLIDAKKNNKPKTYIPTEILIGVSPNMKNCVWHQVKS